MRRTQVQLDDATYDLLRRKAFEDRRSMSAVIRETLAAAFEPGPKSVTRIADFRFVGAGRSRQRSGRPVSEHHDEAPRRCRAQYRPSAVTFLDTSAIYALADRPMPTITGQSISSPLCWLRTNAC